MHTDGSVSPRPGKRSRSEMENDDVPVSGSNAPMEQDDGNEPHISESYSGGF